VIDILGNIPRFVAVATSAALLLSLTHEWAYFSILGRSFQTIVSPQDYLTSTLDWLPGGVLFVLSWWGIGRSVTRLNNAAGGDTTAGFLHRRQRQKIIIGTIFSIAICLWLLSFAYFLDVERSRIGVIGVLLAFCWLIAVTGLVRLKRVSLASGGLFLLGVPVLLWSFFAGLQNAYDDVLRPTYGYLFTEFIRPKELASEI
jgi:hypothetical protein